MVYDDDELNWDGRRMAARPRGIMLEMIVEQPNYDYTDESYREHLITEYGGIPINKDNKTLAKDSDWLQDHAATEESMQITWVARFKEGNNLREVIAAYGNQVAVDYIYCSPCLIVPVDPASERV